VVVQLSERIKAMEYYEIFRKKFETFNELRKSMSEEDAYEKMLEGYPERQRKSLGPFIDNSTLADGFTKAIPIYAEIGMDLAVADISNNNIDAAIEIQRKCPYLEMAKEYGVENPCHIVCDMDIEATNRAFPDMTVRYIARQTQGDSVCAHIYQRPKRV